MAKSSPRKKADSGAERTRGGWVATGVNASRREKRLERADGRADETEEQLVVAARQGFAEQGFYEARIQDVLEIVGMSRGAFYVYFANKREVFDRVHDTVMTEMAKAISGSETDRHSDGPLADLIRANIRFLAFYDENSRILRCLEQVAAVDESAAELSAMNRRHHIQRVERMVRRWQDAGWADPEVDPASAATALVTMLSGSALFMTRGELDQDAEELGASLSMLWTRSIGVDADRMPLLVRSTSN